MQQVENNSTVEVRFKDSKNITLWFFFWLGRVSERSQKLPFEDLSKIK